MVIVLNFGSQFAHLIARRVRDLGVKAEILPFNTPVAEIKKHNPVGIILSGGPASVLTRSSPSVSKEIFALNVPILGICYGQQLIAHILGGKVTPPRATSEGVQGGREFGKETLSVLQKQKGGIFWGLKDKETVWFSHGDHVTRLPRGFVRTASTSWCRNAAFQNTARKIYGIQFHPEVTHTVHGERMLHNFIFDICLAKKNWTIASVKKDIVQELTQRIGLDDHVLIGISGGVDSLVAASLLHRVVGNRLHAVFVDTGLLRKNEGAEVIRSLNGQGFKNIHTIAAGNFFLSRLHGVTDPEKKRRIIGHTFIDMFERAMRGELRRYPIRYFAQGTIYPDRIESASVTKAAAKIKSHHNLTLPRTFRMEVVEPLRDLYKDEVRRLGAELGLPHDLLWRHPFPGPGLGVRIVGEVTRERVRILQEADAIYIDELRQAGEYEKIWQAFAALLPIRTVGVMGDARTYEYMIALRAVDSVDGMSADWHRMPSALLERISNRIVREVRGVNRVLYDVTSKPPATIEYE